MFLSVPQGSILDILLFGIFINVPLSVDHSIPIYTGNIRKMSKCYISVHSST